MRTFRVALNTPLTDPDLTTVTSRGPFLVDGKDAIAARSLVALNFSIGAQRAKTVSARTLLWTDPSRTICDEVFPPEPDAWCQSRLVAGIDMARWFIEELELRRPVDGLIARLRWWPCEPEDICPA